MARFTQNAGGTGSALNYVQVAGDQQIISSAPSSFIDLNITTTGKPVQISVTGEGANEFAGSWVKINLFRDNLAIGNEMQLEASAASENVPYAINFIDPVEAGTYNYSARVTSMSEGNWTFGEVTGPVMNAVELTGFKGDDGADGTDGTANLVVPTAIKDADGYDFISFERTSTNTARIATPQDDLSLRSARDITLYAGDDGPGNVYIGWGDAVYTPDSTNRVATIADIQSAGTGGITFVDNTISTDNGDDIIIQNKTNSDVVTARVVLNQSWPRVAMEALNDQSNYFGGEWSSATWSGNSINFVDAIDIINYFSNTPGNITGISVNGGTIISYEGANFGEGTISLNVGGTPASDPESVNNMTVYYTITSKIDIDYDNGSYDLIAKGMDINLSSDDDVYITAGGDDLFLRANDDVRFSSGYNDPVAIEHQWRMNSEGQFELPGNGYMSNPNATVVTPGNRTVTYTDSYLNNESGIIDQNAVSLPVDVDSTWFANNIYTGIFTSPAVISFADGDSTTAAAIYDATSQGTPAVIFQWNDANRTKTFEQTFPLSVSVDYTTTTYDGNPTIVLDPADNSSHQVLVIEANGNDIHLRTGGAIDQSTAELILGGEDTNVSVSDSGNSVNILADTININSNVAPSSLNINTYSGAVINSNRTSAYAEADRFVATLGDIQSNGSWDAQFTDATGTLAGHTYTGNYNRVGNVIFYCVNVDFAGYTNLGTGQYQFTLPFTPRQTFTSRAGTLHNHATDTLYHIAAIADINESGLGNVAKLYYSGSTTDLAWKYNTPVSWASTQTHFDVSGFYEIEPS